jgi:hypothetical protein
LSDIRDLAEPVAGVLGGKAGRAFFYRLSGLERLVRLGSLGYSAQNLVAVAKRR